MRNRFVLLSLVFLVLVIIYSNEILAAPPIISTAGIGPGTPTTLKAGQIASIDVGFNQNVNVVGGPPKLELIVAPNIRANATYSQGSGTQFLRFTYTVQNGNNGQINTSNSVIPGNPNPLQLNGGTIKNAGLENADLALPGPFNDLGSQQNPPLIFDTAPPSPTWLTPTNSGNFTNSIYNITFNASISELNFAQSVLFSFDNASGTNFNITAVNGSGRWAVQYNVSSLAEGTHIVTVIVNDSMGNWNNTQQISFTVDYTTPVITVSCGDGSFTAGETVTCSCSATEGNYIASGPYFSGTTSSSESTTASGSGSFTSSICSATDSAGNVGTGTGSYILELQEHRLWQHIAHDALRAESWSLGGAVRDVLAARRTMRLAFSLLEHVLQDAVIAHERHAGRPQRIAVVVAEPVFDHQTRVKSVQEIEQIVGIAAHQGAGQEQGFLALACKNPHRLPLSRPLVLVLVPFIHHEKAEVSLRKVALDELRCLVAALPEGELGVGHCTLHSACLPVCKEQIAFVVHQIDELVDVVLKHPGQHVLAEPIQQPVGSFATYGRYLTQALHNQLTPGLGVSTFRYQRPKTFSARQPVFQQRAIHYPLHRLLIGAIGSCLIEPAFSQGRWQGVTLVIHQQSAALRTGCIGSHLLVLSFTHDSPLMGVGRLPVESHAHAHPSHDKELWNDRLLTQLP